MKQPITKSSLCDAQRRAVELFQRYPFCRVTHMLVCDGMPVWDPAPEVIQTVKMGAPNGSRDESNLEDFWLKQPVIEFFETLRELGTGEVLSITVQHGLPHIVEVRRHV